MSFNLLLDDRKVYWIVGIIISICVFIYILPDKHKIEPMVIKQSTGTGIIGYEPRYFNKEIYDLPNAKMSPYMLYGGNQPQLDYSNSNVQLGYERLKPNVDLLPKTTPVSLLYLPSTSA